MATRCRRVEETLVEQEEEAKAKATPTKHS